MAKKPQSFSTFLLVLVILCFVVLLVLCTLLVSMIMRDRQSASLPVPTTSVPEETSSSAPPDSVPETTFAEEPTTEPATTAAETTMPTLPPETTAATEATVPETTEPPTQETTESPTQDTQPQKDPLTVFLEQGGITFDDLEKKNCSQLIIVCADGTYAQIHFYSRGSGQWTEVSSLSCSGRVGRSGASSQKQEGDGTTPTGLYSIGSGFYIHSAPQTGLDLFQVTQDTYWVDDPDSQFYNQRIEGTENKDWDSAEHMIDYSAYRYGFVVDYNLTAEYNAGSAIFFHIGNSSTAGCIATSENMVLAYLAQLDKTQRPHILILEES